MYTLESVEEVPIPIYICIHYTYIYMYTLESVEEVPIYIYVYIRICRRSTNLCQRFKLFGSYLVREKPNSLTVVNTVLSVFKNQV